MDGYRAAPVHGEEPMPALHASVHGSESDRWWPACPGGERPGPL